MGPARIVVMNVDPVGITVRMTSVAAVSDCPVSIERGTRIMCVCAKMGENGHHVATTLIGTNARFHRMVAKRVKPDYEKV